VIRESVSPIRSPAELEESAGLRTVFRMLVWLHDHLNVCCFRARQLATASPSYANGLS
jgi:hypothetical protein